MPKFTVHVSRVVNDLLTGFIDIEASSAEQALADAKAVWDKAGIELDFEEQIEAESPNFRVLAPH